MQRSSLCALCKHLYTGLPRKCAAYPEGIPHRFWAAKEVHLVPAEGDHGIQFEERPGLPQAARDVVQMIVEAHERRQQEGGATDKGESVRPAG